MTRVLVMGGTGMLGAMVARVLAEDPALEVTATFREGTQQPASLLSIQRLAWKRFDAASQAAPPLQGFDWVVNAIGITKPLIKDDDPTQVERAIRINALFPSILAQAAHQFDVRVLQIATDCVYSGRRGNYVESDVHDPLDVYGKSKSLGEIASPNVYHIRCSIIGPECKDFKFLLEWFRRLPPSASVNGFVNHRWNGVTTLHFARACRGIIRNNPALKPVQHLVPRDSMTKADMLHAFANLYGRTDVRINDARAATVVDRILATEFPETSKSIWAAAGYNTSPTVGGMLKEMHGVEFASPAATAA